MHVNDSIPEQLSESIHLTLNAARVNDYVGGFLGKVHYGSADGLAEPPTICSRIEARTSELEG